MNTNKTNNPQRMLTWNIILSSIGGLLFITQIALCFLSYNTVALDWLLYFGWGILAVSIFLGWRARLAFETKGKASSGNWLHTSTVIDSGIYGIVRHPMYLSFMLIVLALVLISQHWLSVISGIILVAMLYSVMQQEERGNVEKFGDEYIQYMRKVPSANFVIGFIRFLQRRAKNEGQ